MLLECNNLTKKFGEFAALSNVSFSVEEGEIIGIAGANGAGKTTLFQVISGFYKPTEGKIFFNGKEITGRKPHIISQSGIARTFQIPAFFSSLSVFNNVKLAFYYGKAKDFKNIDDLLHFTNLNENVHTIASTLSLLDIKRLMLTLALAISPRLVLLDEILAGLSPAEIRELKDLIQQISNLGKTIIWIEHHMSALVELCSKMIILQYGQKIAEGEPNEVINDKEVIVSFLGKVMNHKKNTMGQFD